MQKQIIRKNKDYSSVQEAQLFYEKERMKNLAEILFPVSEYPEGFKENLIGLMKYQNPVQMNVWHNKMKGVVNQSTGQRIITTWENMCTFGRPFQCAEMYQCLEILKRVTPNELYNEYDSVNYEHEKFLNKDNSILFYFNEVAYPKIEEIANSIQKVLDEIEEQVMSPIRSKINADLKVMMQLSVGENVEFIKPRQRVM